ncbi:MAG: baseplate J/gp47 family protein [Campylobacterota bacterium]
MNIPPMCEIKTFDQIKSELVAIHQTNVPEYVPNESDDTMPLIGTFSYRELQLRTHVNELVRQSFWQTATGEHLDFHAAEFFIKRDKGAKPTATVRFTLNTTFPSAYVFEAGLVLVNTDGSTAELLADVTISAGMTEADGIVELQIYTAGSDATVVSTMVPKAYLSSTTQLTPYANGSNPMEDEALRALIALANEQFTTAGSIQSYKYWALQSDARIDDVHVYRITPGEVEVVVHSLVGVDAAMLSRVESSVSAEIHRPLNDTVNVRAATIINYTVAAVISVSPDVDAATTLAEAKSRLEERLSAIGIGKSVTIGMIIAALSVDGVEDVSVSSPAATVGCGEDEVAIPTTVEVSVG